MPANTLAITPRLVKGVAASVSAATTDQTGATTTNLVLLYTAAATGAPPADGQGAILMDITVTVPVTAVAAVWMLFKKTGGTMYPCRPAGSTGIVPATTVSTTVPGYTTGKLACNETLAPGDSIYIGTTIAQQTVVTGNVGEY